MSIWNWNEICDECGQPHAEWYDFGTTVICRNCLREHQTFHGKCEMCGDEEADIYYQVGTQTICGECVRDLERR